MNRIKIWIILGGCLLNIAGVWGAFTLLHRFDKDQAVAAARTNASNLCRAFEEDVLRTVHNIDSLLLLLRSDYHKSPQSIDERLKFYTSANSHYRDLLIQVSIIDRNGILTYNNHTKPVMPMDLSDREHFKVHLSDSGDNLFISKPVLGRVSGKWSIQFTRKLMDRSGSFDGVIVFSINPDYFTSFFRTVDVGDQGVITLIGSDRVIRARASGKDARQMESKGGMIPERKEIFSANAPTSGIYMAESSVDGIMRHMAFRKLKDYPLIVIVGISQAELYKPVESRRSFIVTAGILITFGLLCGFGIILFLERKEQRMARELAERGEELKSMLDEVERLATTDPLTGLLNRRAFFNRAQEEVTRIKRYPGDLSLIMLDLDHFKLVNDSHGHITGDNVLRHAAKIMQREVRENDLVARYGGEEFVMLLIETSCELAMTIAERIRSAIEASPYISDTGLQVGFTVSLGVVSNDTGAVDTELDKLLAKADEALYKAKGSGRNRAYCACIKKCH